MVRIFAVLAALSAALLIFNFALGLGVGGLGQAHAAVRPLNHKVLSLRRETPIRPQELEEAEQQLLAVLISDFRPVEARAFVHVNLGVVLTLFAVMVSSIGVTYFVGTGKWVSEVVGAYQLPAQWIERSRLIRRQAFPWAVTGFLVLLGNACLGMLSYVDAVREEHFDWPTAHLATACLSLFLLAGAYYVQWLKIVEQVKLIQEVLARVQEIRAERGLPVES